MIFISIASYCDPQLVPTIDDCLAKAAHPQDLRFGICWQHRDGDEALPFAADPRFRIINVDWRESRGACWARAQCMSLFAGEDWFLQLDAHHRFVQNWDAVLLQTAARTGSAKPILTGLTPAFKPDDPDSFQRDPKRTVFKAFGPEGFFESFTADAIPDWRDRHGEPVRARFITAGFVFAPGQFVRDVPYDPDLYFWGEETMLTIRAFTHGYDLFHPSEIILWHYYVSDRTGSSHWHDHATAYVDAQRPSPLPDASGPLTPVTMHPAARDNASRQKVRRFIEAPFVGPFGCGTVRTFQDYERYAGLNFRYRCATDYTRRYLEPPNPPLPDDWALRMCHYDVTICLDKAALAAVDGGPDCSWRVGLWDRAGEVVYQRTEMDKRFRADLVDQGTTMMLRVLLASQAEPVLWQVIPYNGAAWLTPFEGASPRAWAQVRRSAPWVLMDGRGIKERDTPVPTGSAA